MLLIPRRKRIKSLVGAIGVIGATLGLAACQTGQAVLTGKAGRPLIESVAPVADQQPLASGYVPSKGLLAQRTWGDSIVSAPSAEKYLNDVLAKVQAAWPGKRLPARVYITPSLDFEGYSTEDGAILLTLGMLKSLESEDELAALLGHEYAHVVLGHHEKSILETVQKTGYGLAKIYLSFKGNISGTTQEDLIRNYIINEAILESGMTGLLPAWGRFQEYEADKVGADLMIRAGYNLRENLSLLERMENWEQQNEKKSKLHEDLGAKIVTSKAGGGVHIDFKPVVEEAKVAAGEAKEQLSKQHASAVERQAALKEYIREAHAGAERPAKQVQPYRKAMSQPDVRRAQDAAVRVREATAAVKKGDVKRAAAIVGGPLKGSGRDIPVVHYAAAQIYHTAGQGPSTRQALATAVNHPDSMLYAHLMDVKFNSGDAKQALQRLDQIDAAFGEPDATLPAKVYWSVKAGDSVRAQLLQLKCVSTGDNALGELCDKAAKGVL